MIPPVPVKLVAWWVLWLHTVGSPFRRCDAFLWYGCWCLCRARSLAWLFDLWWSCIPAGWISLQLDLSGQMKSQDTQRSHTPTLIFSHHDPKLYCSTTSTFIASADSPSPAVTLHHGTCTMEQRVNHMWCLSCCDKAICKSTLLFFSPSPSSLGGFEPPNKGEVLFWVETIIKVWDLMLSD